MVDLSISIYYDDRARPPGWYVRASQNEGYASVLQPYRLTPSEVELFVEHGERAMRGTDDTGPLTAAVKKANARAKIEQAEKRRRLEQTITEAQRALDLLNQDAGN